MHTETYNLFYVTNILTQRSRNGLYRVFDQKKRTGISNASLTR